MFFIFTEIFDQLLTKYIIPELIVFINPVFDKCVHKEKIFDAQKLKKKTGLNTQIGFLFSQLT